MRVGVDARLRVGDADLAQEVDSLRTGLLARGAVMDANRFRDLIADGEHRVQARHRILKDHCDVAAAELGHAILGQVQEVDDLAVASAEADRTAFNPARRAGEKAHDGKAGHGLPRPGLADDREGLALGDAERHPVDGAHDASIGMEVGPEVLDAEHRLSERHSAPPPPKRSRYRAPARPAPR